MTSSLFASICCLHPGNDQSRTVVLLSLYVQGLAETKSMTETKSMAEKKSRQFDIVCVCIDLLFASGVWRTSICCVAVFICSRSV